MNLIKCLLYFHFILGNNGFNLCQNISQRHFLYHVMAQEKKDKIIKS